MSQFGVSDYKQLISSKNNIEEKQLYISRWRIVILGTPTSVDILGIHHQDALRFLLLTFGTCSTELMINYHAPPIAQWPGIGVYKATYLHVILYFGHFYPSFKKKKTWFVSRLSSSTTKATLFGFKPKNS